MRTFSINYIFILISLSTISISAQTDISGYFNNEISYGIVACTLEGGVSSTCYEIVFASNPVSNGPYCPADTNSIGGFGVYDGSTNPGFQVMKSTLFVSMEADGYDIVRNNGTIRTQDLNSGGGGGGNPSYSYCLDNTPDDDLQLTFLIPTTPFNPPTVNQMTEVELVAVSVDGVPMNSDPPSVSSNNGNIPAIDPCGGHMDPAGYYHWHFAPESINNVLSAYGISDVSCTNISQNVSALTGFAKDGYPIYASREPNGSLPTGLDECFGHTANTIEFGNTYHYHVSDVLAPSMPPCIKGVSAQTPFVVEPLVLPIDLILFKASNVDNEKVKLHWITASESNNDFFTVECSRDGELWEEKVIIDGAGKSERTLEYIDFDEYPLKGLSYYRLKQTDFEGKYSYSEIQSVRLEEENTSVLIYPHPVIEDFFTIKAQIKEIELYDNTGVIVHTQDFETIENIVKIKTSTLKSGVYFLKIFDGIKVQTEKVIIQKR